MNRIKVMKLKPELSGASLDEIEEWIKKQQNFTGLNTLNWPLLYPYLPFVRFALYYNNEGFYLYFEVQEEDLRVRELKDNGRIWEDSCVEFFVQPEAGNGYYNLEFNAAGSLLLGYGHDRNNRIRANEELLNSVSRMTRIQIERSGNQSLYRWSLMTKIPFNAFFANGFNPSSANSIKGNFYKCGDKTAKPHYVSWSPIATPSPDFHRPEYFGCLDLTHDL